MNAKIFRSDGYRKHHLSSLSAYGPDTTLIAWHAGYQCPSITPQEGRYIILNLQIGNWGSERLSPNSHPEPYLPCLAGNPKHQPLFKISKADRLLCLSQHWQLEKLQGSSDVYSFRVFGQNRMFPKRGLFWFLLHLPTVTTLGLKMLLDVTPVSWDELIPHFPLGLPWQKREAQQEYKNGIPRTAVSIPGKGRAFHSRGRFECLCSDTSQ